MMCDLEVGSHVMTQVGPVFVWIRTMKPMVGSFSFILLLWPLPCHEDFLIYSHLWFVSKFMVELNPKINLWWSNIGVVSTF